MSKQQSKADWKNIFGRNFNQNHYRAIKKFRKSLPRRLGIFPRKITRGELSQALYNSNVVRSSQEAESLCNLIDQNAGAVIKMGIHDSFHLERKDDGKYSARMMTSYTGPK